MEIEHSEDHLRSPSIVSNDSTGLVNSLLMLRLLIGDKQIDVISIPKFLCGISALRNSLKYHRKALASDNPHAGERVGA